MNVDPIAQFRYANLLIPKLREVIAQTPIAIVPIGILEWHGNHNAVGMDGYVAENLCDRVMAQLQKGVVMPLHWIGTYGYVHYEGTVCYEEAVAAQYLTQLLIQIVKLGFRLVVLISGHGGKWQQTAIQTAVNNTLKLYAKMPNELTVIGVIYPELAPQVKVTHAGLQETAMLWRIGQIKNIDLVNMEYFSATPETLALYKVPNEANVTIHEDTLWPWDEIFPNADQCTPELGEQLLTTITEGILEEIKCNCEEMKIIF